MKNRIYKVVAMFTVIGVMASCDLDINQDPNNATSATLEQLLPSSQISIGAIFGGQQTDGSGSLNEDPSIFIQHYNYLDEGRFDIDGSDYDANWRDIYIEGLNDMQRIIEIGTETEQWHHVGIAQIQKAMIFSIMVDLFGELPYFDALSGQANLHPAFDDGQLIYDDLFILVDAGIANLQQTVAVGVVNDLFYGGDATRWIAAANTLKLKMHNQCRLVDPTTATTEINSLIAGGLITGTANDLEFQYGSSNSPLNQHPLYVENYTSGPLHYMSAYMVFEMNDSNDPRVPYYFFRQSLEDPTGDNVPCDDITSAPAIPYGVVARDCYYGNGFYSRIQGDDSGLPNDDTDATTFGVYPAGGVFDAVAIDPLGNPITSRTVNINSSTGDGIQPLVTYFMSLFIQAEAALTLGTTGDPRALLEQGIRAQVEKVVAFGAARGGWGLSSPILDNLTGLPIAQTVQERLDAYVTNVLADYDAATNDEERLQVVMTEYHKATYGIGWEAYNAYRRTGYPLFYNMNAKDGTTVTYPASATDAAHSQLGAFPRRMLYSQRELNTNTSAPESVVQQSVPVFWDNN